MTPSCVAIGAVLKAKPDIQRTSRSLIQPTMKVTRYLQVTSSLIALALVGCSTEEPLRPANRFPDARRSSSEKQASVPRFPFEIWVPFRDVEGGQITNKLILLGDEHYQQGRRKDALRAYGDALAKTQLSNAEREALVIRVASLQLAQDETERTLRTISDYFRYRGLSEEEVGVPFSLILAYGYGRKSDINQSLAWFSRAFLIADGKGPAAEASRLGVGLLLRTIPDVQFEQMAANWRNDEFVNSIIGRERSRRSGRGYHEVLWDTKRAFWLMDSGEQSGEVAPLPSTGEPTIALLLSLNDKLASLSRSTREGVELAILSDTGSPKIRLEVRDVGSSPISASTAVRELQKADVFLGPLLSEPATAAADTAREVNAPLVALSKSESFRTGDGVYRLGATTSSQVEALVKSAYGHFEITRFGLVYPADGNGTESARAFKEQLARLGLTLVFETSYGSADDVSLLTAAREIETHDAGAVFIPDDLGVASKILSNLPASVRKRSRALGPATWDNPVKLANSQALFESALFVSPFFSESARPVVRQFIDSYKGHFQASPNFLAAQGFDAATLLISALRRAKADGDPLRVALGHLPPYEGATGLITISGSGEFERVFKVIEVANQGFVELPDLSSVAPHRTNVIMRGDQVVSGPPTDGYSRDVPAR